MGNLVQLYIARYENEQESVQSNVDRCGNETHNLEQALADYIGNRNELLSDIHRILRCLNEDAIAVNEYHFIPESYTDNLPESVQQKYENLKAEAEANKV